MSIFNQESLIERVLYGIFRNTTTPFNLILVFDGCTDRTEPRAMKYIEKHRPENLKEIKVTHAPNVYETRANNIGFKMVEEDYMITLQDDMVINELGWEIRLTYPLRVFDDVLAVGSRMAQDIKSIGQDGHNYINVVSRETKNHPRDLFAVRDVINRGPVAFSMKHLRSMGYFNENYAPSDLDDADLCLRAWRDKKLKVGAYWIDYISKFEWGKARADDSTMGVKKSISVNAEKIKNDHSDYLNSESKHDEDITLKEKDVDYVDSSSRISFIWYPTRVTYKLLRKKFRLYKQKIKSVILRLFR